jgi:redox-sensitive bicupin YhaK (pirin superfamily)
MKKVILSSILNKSTKQSLLATNSRRYIHIDHNQKNITYPNTIGSTIPSVQIRKVIDSTEQDLGSSGRIVRAIGPYSDVEDVDPILLFEEFTFTNELQGFEKHPHRGFQIMQYVLDGEIFHQDSKHVVKTLYPGDLIYMNAGKGILHSEAPNIQGTCRGIEVWVNLPDDAKMKAAKVDFSRCESTAFSAFSDHVTVKVISGRSESCNKKSRLQTYQSFNWIDINITRPGVVFGDVFPGNHQGLFYIIEGKGKLLNDPLNEVYSARQCLVFEDIMEKKVEKQKFEWQAIDASPLHPFRVMFLSAKPILQPICRRGPVVMASKDDLDQAFVDLANGNYG